MSSINLSPQELELARNDDLQTQMKTLLVNEIAKTIDKHILMCQLEQYDCEYSEYVMRKAIKAGEETSISESEFLHRKAAFVRLKQCL